MVKVRMVVGIACSSWLGAWGCGGTQPPAEPAPQAIEEPEPIAPVEDAEEPAPEPVVERPSVEPEFRPGMSVREAIDAVPQSADRINIDQETLAEPLLRMELYEPCALRPNQRFRVHVAVWNGQAVGVDVTTTPNHPQAADCIRKQVESVAWVDKVKSLNTVEFSY